MLLMLERYFIIPGHQENVLIDVFYRIMALSERVSCVITQL